MTEGLHDGLLEADTREMIKGVIELGDADAAVGTWGEGTGIVDSGRPGECERPCVVRQQDAVSFMNYLSDHRNKTQSGLILCTSDLLLASNPLIESLA